MTIPGTFLADAELQRVPLISTVTLEKGRPSRFQLDIHRR